MNFNKLIKEQETKEDIKTFTMLKKIKEKKVKTRADFEKACKALCYKSFAFCCDITKPCLFRNSVLDALGISIKDFRKIKMKWHEEFVERFLR